jgi:Flp pilus assembly protein CpaB
VAARPILPGQPLTADDIRFEALDLPDGLAAAAFSDASAIEGRVALGPIGDGELVQLGHVSDPGQASPAAELSFSIARDRAVDGRLRSGDLVDVFVTDDGGTSAVAEGVTIVDATAHDGGTFDTTGELTITLTLADPALRAPLIQAVREGEVTLVRSTHLSGGGG